MAIEPLPIEIDLRESRKSHADLSTLLWLCGWGVATAVALGALVITSQTQTAHDRLRSIFALNEPAAVAQIPPRVAQLESETRALAGQIRSLNAERARLAGRVALLESSVDDMSAAIKRQAAATAAVIAAKAATLPAIPPATISATPSATVAHQGATMPGSGPKADPVNTASVPLPPERSAAAQSAAEPDPSATSANEFGLDLGGASTLDGVRQRWMTLKGNFGSLLSGLHPLAAAERRQGKAGYRLVVGPLPNSPAAAGLCAHFNAAHTACRPVKFDGEQIAQR
jgi:hypothetical protein